MAPIALQPPFCRPQHAQGSQRSLDSLLTLARPPPDRRPKKVGGSYHPPEERLVLAEYASGSSEASTAAEGGK